MDVRADPTRQLVRLRGRSYVAFVFSPVVPIVEWLAEIDATLARSPGYFVGKPIVLDLAAVDLSSSAIAHLVGSLNERSIRVLGIEGVEEERLAANMPPLLTGGRACVITRNEPAQKPEPEAKPKPTSLLLDSPVRSGQSIVFMEGDVTVLGSVGSGAEIVAGGSIHIYGDAARPRDGGRQRQFQCADLLPEDRGRAARHRRLLPDCRRNRRLAPQPPGASLAGGRHHENYPAELTG